MIEELTRDAEMMVQAFVQKKEEYKTKNKELTSKLKMMLEQTQNDMQLSEELIHAKSENESLQDQLQKALEEVANSASQIDSLQRQLQDSQADDS